MRTLAGILVCLLLAFGAHAQSDTADTEPDDVHLYADFGFDGVMPGSRNTPVRLWVQAQDEDISGHIEFSYLSDRGLSGRVMTPVDVPAGQLSSVSIVAPISIWTQRVQLVLRSQSGARLAEIGYASLPSPTELQLPTSHHASVELLLSTTSRTSAEIIARELTQQTVFIQGSKEAGLLSDEPQSSLSRHINVFANLVGVDVRAEELPLSQMAYEGVAAVVADSITVQNADPRAISALHRWVLGGGRLVVIADMPGELWRRLLPPITPAESISLGVQREMQIPSDLAAASGESPSRTLLARPIGLALPATDAGWQTRWNIGNDALLAEGPAGFGWVTVVSVHPDGAEFHESWRVWAEVLDTACEVVSMVDSSARAVQVESGSWYQRGYTKQVPVYIFDAISTAAPIGNAAFMLVAFVTISLALALGPVDFLILKFMKLRHLAWLSAMIWIAVAAAVGVVMPDRLRAGPSSVARLSVVDQFVVNDALQGGDAHQLNAPIAQLPESLSSWRLAFTNVFSGSRGDIRIDAEDSGVYWTEYSGFRGASVISRPMTAVQNPKSGGLDAVRSSAPRAINPGVWTSRVYTETGPAASPIGVSLAADEQGWRAEVSGLGESARVIAGQLRVGDRYFTVPPTANRIGTSFRFYVPTNLSTAYPMGSYGEDSESQSERRYINSMYFNRTLEEIQPPLVHAVAGPQERTVACERLLETGRFAMLDLFVTDQPADVTVTADELDTTQSTIYRLMIPIEGDPFSD